MNLSPDSGSTSGGQPTAATRRSEEAGSYGSPGRAMR